MLMLAGELRVLGQKFIRYGLACTLLYGCSLACVAQDIRLALVSHAPNGDPWWQVVKNAIRDADEDFGVKTDYLNPPEGGAAGMNSILIRLAHNSGYDGVISTIPELAPLKEALQNISGRRIPLITINAGNDTQSKAVDAYMHIGQNDFLAGKEAGKMARSAGVSSFLCISHLGKSDAALERCSGFAEALNVDVKSSMLEVGNNSDAAQNDITAYLNTHPRPDAILTLGPLSAEPALTALERLGLAGKVYFATFDYSPRILVAIRNGKIQFAIDQQPYLQGYLPVAIMAIMLKEHTQAQFKIRELLNANQNFHKRLDTYNLKPSYNLRTIRSGPAFITRANVDKVEAYAGQYR